MEATLQHQLCFPMYLASKELVKKYDQLLATIDLTYTQYIVMMVLWEGKDVDMKELSRRLYLHSNTLTPVIDRLVAKQYLSKARSEEDKRFLKIRLEDRGRQLKQKAQILSNEVANLVELTEQESQFLYKVLYKVIDRLAEIKE